MTIISLVLAFLSLHFKPSFHSKKKTKKSKGKQSKSEEEDSFGSDLEATKSLLERRYPKGKEKFKGKFL